eukprot:CAMPEP_0167747612 /NCGR_PEP_ID=MMETSP0110_2-20121227/4381_1 /TAXON_ID=629695 /ORGANISM="Gymnochlora sp., Strain CCMP2014" /LENGTH=503 /DNA_ID=CAMNT_0007632539 /DNA_START=659 /DNA_END=2170 /DNA_ORIENTATION=+
MKGYYFGMGSKGLGYYRDAPPVIEKETKRHPSLLRIMLHEYMILHSKMSLMRPNITSDGSTKQDGRRIEEADMQSASFDNNTSQDTEKNLGSRGSNISTQHSILQATHTKNPKKVRKSRRFITFGSSGIKENTTIRVFTPTEKFNGKRDGYAFTLGDNGLGYYPLSPPKSEKLEVLKGIRALGEQKMRAIQDQDEKPDFTGVANPSNIKIQKNAIQIPTSWNGVLNHSAAIQKLAERAFDDPQGLGSRYQSLFIGSRAVNHVVQFDGWKQGYYYGTGEFGTGYYRDFYYDLIMMAKQHQLRLKGISKTIEELKMEEMVQKGVAKDAMRGVGSNRFKGLDENGNPILAPEFADSGQQGMFKKHVNYIVDKDKDGKEFVRVYTQYKNFDGVGLPDYEDHKEFGRTVPMEDEDMDSIKAYLLRDDGTGDINKNYFSKRKDHRTAAQKEFDERWMKDLKRRRDLVGGKSYRQRIQEMNHKLGNMSEFYDLFRTTEWSEGVGKKASRM